MKLVPRQIRPLIIAKPATEVGNRPVPTCKKTAGAERCRSQGLLYTVPRALLKKRA